MFIVVPFIISTGLAIVAEADLLCGEFLSEKSCRHTMVVSASFWYWLLNVFFSFDMFEIHSDNCFGLLMHCGYADDSWYYYVFDFGL